MSAGASFIVRPPTSQATSRQSSTGPDSDSSSTFRRPALPRHLALASSTATASSPLARSGKTGIKRAFGDDSDDETGDTEDELVTGFDQKIGVERPNRKVIKTGPLVIPALANRDWRAEANERRQSSLQGRFLPPAARARQDLGTRDSINSGPEAVGLVKRVSRAANGSGHTFIKPEPIEPKLEDMDIDEDERARRALLASLNGADEDAKPTVDAIAMQGNTFAGPESETDAYRKDVVSRPDSSTLDDYEAVPIEEFGAAMLRGMGWHGTSKDTTLPYLPESRPALLGIGAKERAAEDIPLLPGQKPKKKGGKPDMKYTPLVRKEKSASSSAVPSRSVSPARRDSQRRSPSARRDGSDSSSRRDKDRGRHDYDSDRKYDRDSDRRRDDRDQQYNDRRNKDLHRDRDGRERSRRSSRERDSDYRSDKDRSRRDRDH